MPHYTRPYTNRPYSIMFIPYSTRLDSSLPLHVSNIPYLSLRIPRPLLIIIRALPVTFLLILAPKRIFIPIRRNLLWLYACPLGHYLLDLYMFSCLTFTFTYTPTSTSTSTYPSSIREYIKLYSTQPSSTQPNSKQPNSTPFNSHQVNATQIKYTIPYATLDATIL